VARKSRKARSSIGRLTFPGFTIHAATIIGQQRVCRVLLEQGEPVDAANPLGETPLGVAVREGHQNLAFLLLDYGADIEKVMTERPKGTHFVGTDHVVSTNVWAYAHGVAATQGFPEEEL